MSIDRRRFLLKSTAAAVGLGALPAGFPPAVAADLAWAGEAEADRSGAMPVQDWLDGFFRAYYARRPVNATFIGIHDHDHVLPDFSEQGAGDTLAEMEELPAEWTARAIRECEGARLFLTEGIDILSAENQITTPGFRRAAERAATVFADFETHLETELLTRTADELACGEEAFRLYLTDGHFVETEPEEIVRYAEERAAEAQAELESAARALGAVDSTEALAGLRSAHPTTDAYYDRYGQVWDEMRDVVEEGELLTWPDPELPIRYVARPAWAPPYLYFLSYRAPAAFGRPSMHDYLVRAIDTSLPAERQEELLRGTNDSVIKLNHVIHHGHVGHHVQNSYAYRSASRIGQVAAVDCASRIAMFCGGTMAEGWASYSTALMREAGALTPLEALSELKGQLRMYARAVVDVRLHLGHYTLEEAAEHYEREADMTPGSARGEAVRNSMFPGTAVMYMLGREEIRRLRREMEERQGDRFSLRRFHDALLSYGSIPVSLIGASMRDRESDTG